MRISIEFGDFSREVRDAAQNERRVRVMAGNSVRRAAFDLERGVKIRMPVDTGRARASWGHSKPPANPDDGIWIEDEQKMEIVQGTKVPYVQALNEGSSRQAPAAFIDAEARRVFNDLEALLLREIGNLR